jgi:hypothetical protein
MKIIPPSFHRFWTSDRSLRVFLWLLILSVFFVTPLDLMSSAAKFAASLFFSLLFIAGASAVAQSRKVFLLVAFSLILTLCVHWLGWIMEHQSVNILDVAATLIFLLIITALLGSFVARAETVNLHTIEGGIAIYILLGSLWSQVYLLLELVHPGSFSFTIQPATVQGLRAALNYFSMVTLTTVGYGDITAVHSLARSFSSLEAFVGQLYPAILLARLVSLEIMSRAETRGR